MHSAIFNIRYSRIHGRFTELHSFIMLNLCFAPQIATVLVLNKIGGLLQKFVYIISVICRNID